MKRFTNLKKSVAVLLALIIALSSFSILTVFAADVKTESSGADFGYVTVNGATIDELSSTGLTYITLKTSTAYGITWKAGNGIDYVEFKNQVTGKKDRFWTDDVMGYDKAVYADGKAKLAFCIQPHTRYLDGYQSLTDVDSTANKSYWNKFKNNTKLYNAIAEVIAFARPRITGSDAEKHSNYIATQLIIWEYICGYRSTSTHQMTSGGINLTKFIYGDNAKISKIKSNYKEILDAIGDADKVGKKLCSTLAKAKKAHNPKNTETNFVLNKNTHSKTRKIPGYDPDLWGSPKIVNQNNNTPAASWGFKLTQDGKKFTVKADKSIADEKTDSRFFIRFKKKLTYSKASTDIAYNTSSSLTGAEGSQTIVSELAYSKDVYAYYPISEEDIPVTEEYGALMVKKTAENSSGEAYSKSLKGWTFAAKNLSSNKTSYLVTDKEGESDEISDIPLNTQFEITEIGKELPEGYNADDYTNIKKYDGVTYGFPRGWESKTTGPKTVTVNKSDEVEVKTVSWKNVYDKPYKIEIEKITTDGSTTDGWYFAVADKDLPSSTPGKKLLLNNAKILGPTTNSITKTYLDYVGSDVATNTLYIRELGLLKKGETFTDAERTISFENLREKSGACSKFKIPDRFSTGYPDDTATWMPLGGKQAFANNEKFTFYHYDFINWTKGYFKIHKTDANTGKKLTGAVYGVYLGKAEDFESSQNKPEDTPEETLAPDTTPTEETDPPVEDETDETTPSYEEDADDTGFEDLNTGVEKPKYTITIDKNGEGISPYLITGSYYIKELVPPKGYKLDEKRYDVTLDVGHNTKETALRVDVTDIPTEVIINKKAASALDNNGKQLAGAELEIYTIPNPNSDNEEDKTEKLIYSFTSSDNPEKLTGILEEGKKYRLHEKKAPDGYCLADDITFTVSKEEKTTTVTMEDKSTKIKVAKLDSETGKYIENATLQILKNGQPVEVPVDGKKVTSFKSKNEPIIFEGVFEAGDNLVLHEEYAPDGYILTAEDVPFVVDEDGKEVTVSISNKPLPVEFYKTDFVTGKEVPGCVLQVIDKETGKVVDEWTSTTEAHVIKRLVIGKTYIMTETSPLDGYTTAESVEFTVTGAVDPVQKVEMKNKPTEIEISKVDITDGKEIKDCKLKVIDKETKEEIESWTSGKEAHVIKGKCIINRTYTLIETYPADGFKTAKSVDFTVVDNHKVAQKVKMEDEPTEVEFSKTKYTDGEELPGCGLKVTDEDGNTIEEWVSTKETHIIKGKLIVGKTYTLTETYPADFYMSAKSISFTVADEEGKVQKVHMVDKPTEVEISKTSIVTGKELPGCKLEVAAEDGTVIDSWTSTEEPHIITGKLIVGHKYTLTETKPTDGYTTAESIQFAIKDTDELKNGKRQKIVMENNIPTVEFYKTSVTDENEVPDCKLKVVDKETGEEIDSWTSSTSPHMIVGNLVVNKTYTLIESYPADGYTTANSVDFIVEDTNKIQKVVMKNSPTKVEISKKDITTGEELPGCKLELYDDQNVLVDSWTSADTPHYIEGKLAVNRTYTLIEKTPADGFTTAESVEFTVDDNNEVTQKVEMKDVPTRVEISKKAITGSEELEGCKLKIVEKDNEENEVESWTSTSKPHIITGKLVAGKTYILIETKPTDGFTTAESIEFTVTDNFKAEQKIEMKDEPTRVVVSKKDITDGEELPGCHLRIIRKSDEEEIIKWISTDEPYLIEGKLVAGESYILEETKPVDGFTTAESIEFTVDDNYKVEQMVEMKDAPTKVRIKKVDSNTGKMISGAELKIVDADNKPVTVKVDGKEKSTFTSTDEPFLIEGSLTVGQKYTLVEVKAPKGYLKAKPVEFTVEDAEEQTIVMKDDKDVPPPVTGGSALPLFSIVAGALSLILAGLAIFLVGYKKKSNIG